MNIFYLSNNPADIAQWQMDKHCVKMVLETAMLLSTAHRVLDGKEVEEKKMVAGSFPVRWRKSKKWVLNDDRDSILYKDSHVNHPSAIWVRQSNSNYRWLHNLLVELCKEYTFRYGKIHKCESIGLVDVLNPSRTTSPKGNLSEPTPAMPEEVKILNDSVASYRNYYNKCKQHLANWDGKVNSRPVPEWFEHA